MSQINKTRHPARDDRRPTERSSLDTYLDDAGTYALLSAEEELSQARRIADLRDAYWRALLSLPSLLEPIIDTTRVILSVPTMPRKEVDVVRRALDDLRRQHDERRARAVSQATAALAKRLGELDVDRNAADAIARDIEALCADRPTNHLRLSETPTGNAFRAYVNRVKQARSALHAARNRFVCANLRLVVRVAQRYSRNRLSLPDLVQEGNLGLMKAVDRFDPDKGCRFSTYAAWWIRHAITRALVNRGRTVRIPAHLHNVFTKMQGAQRALAGELGRDPTCKEIAARIHVSTEKVELAREAMELRAVALDAPLTPNDTRSASEVLEDAESTHWADDIDDLRHSTLVKNAITDLEPLERDIILHRYGLRDNGKLTLQKLGERHQLSRERIRQLQKKALGKLRRSVESNPLPTAAFL